MKIFRAFACFVGGLLLTTAAFAQGNLTGTVSGHVIDQNGGALPGATVTAKSPNLQGSRNVVTTTTGDYIIPFLPPGEYTVTFELKGFETAQQKTLVTASATVTLDAKLTVGRVTNEVTVTGAITDSVVPGISSSVTLKQKEINDLPLNRGIDATTALAPGVLRTGPSNQNGVPSLSISGGITSENLVLVNGVVAEDNVRRSSLPVYIEDALQETSITTSGVSAEYGRFAGGVVNAITRSGGNTFSGTYRFSLNNDSWRTVTPFPGETKADVTVPINEYTLGGPVLRDRLWFFTAGRFQTDTLAQQLFKPVLTPYDRVTLRRRFEGKGTYSLSPGQTIRVAYVNNYTRTTNGSFQNELDLQSLTNREDPEHTWSATYNGVLKQSIFVEAQYAIHRSSIIGAGSKSMDLIDGTLMVDGLNGGRFNSATFCGVCRPEDRDNTDFAIKASYFATRPGWGTHTVVAGYDRFADQIAADNHQSGSDYRIFTTDTIYRNGTIYPILDPTPGSTLIRYNPISNPTQGSNFLTHSVFFNDLWRLTDRMSLNVGVRFDRNGGTDSAGAKAIDGSKFSPRLGLTFDPKGDGNWILNASYATYVSSINNGFANNGSSAGAPARLDFDYLGPAVNLDPNAPNLVSTHDAIQTVFTWFNANGGLSRQNVGAAVPGVNRKVSADMVPPSVDEVAGGVTRRLGSRGTVRADAVYRKFRDFYSDRVDTTTGQVSNSLGSVFDIIVTENTNKIERQYSGLNLSGAWRPNTRTILQFAYTLSHTWGNAEGENSASGPITATVDMYPEYREIRWNNPIGDLSVDQRHKARIVATYDMPLSRFGTLTVGAIEYLGSGNPYGAVGSIVITPYVPANLGYKGAPSTVNYYFTDRDAFRSQAWYSTDLAATYAYRAPGLAKAEIYVKLELLNTFNQHSIINTQFLNTAVLTNSTTPAKYTRFNPFTDTPVQGTHWDLGPTFGQATSRFAYQTPRTFRMSLGIRF